MADVTQLGRSLGGHKSTLTRRLKSADQLILSAQTDKSSHIAGQLERMIERIEGDVDKIEEAGKLYLDQLTDTTAYNNAQRDIDNRSDEAINKIFAINTILKSLTAPTQPLTAPPPPGTAGPKVKPNEALNLTHG